MTTLASPRARVHRHRHAIRAVEELERRSMLSAVYPSGFIGPVPAGAEVARAVPLLATTAVTSYVWTRPSPPPPSPTTTLTASATVPAPNSVSFITGLNVATAVGSAVPISYQITAGGLPIGPAAPLGVEERTEFARSLLKRAMVVRVSECIDLR
jgi:hypothetical protein